MTRSVTSRALALAVFGSVIVLLLAGGFAQPTLADEGNETIAIDREGDELNITVDESEVESFDTVVVQINDSEDSESWENESAAEEFEEEISLFDPPGSDPLPSDLTDASVEVSLLDDGTQVDNGSEPSLSLYAIDADEDPDVSFDGEALSVTVDDIVGTESVEVDLTDDGESDAEVDADETGDGWQLSLPLETVRDADVTGEVDVVAFPADEAETASAQEAETEVATVEPTDHVDDAELTVDDGTLVLHYALIKADEDYVVEAGGEREPLTADEAGVLDLSRVEEDVLLSEATMFSLSRSGEDISDTELTTVDPTFDDQELLNRALSVADESERVSLPFTTFEGQQPRIEYPLLFEGETYGVVIERPDGNMTLWTTAEEGELVLPEKAETVLVDSNFSISVFDEERRLVLEDEPLDEQEPISLELEEQQLNASEANLQIESIERIWLGHNDTTILLEEEDIDADAGLIDISALETEPGVNDTLGLVVDYQTGAESLSVNVSESPAEGSPVPVGMSLFLTVWIGIAALSGFVLFVTRKTRFGQRSTYGIGMIGLAVLHGLLLSLVVYGVIQAGVFELGTGTSLTALLVGAGAVLVTLLVFLIFILFRQQPKDLNMMLIAGALGVSASGLFLITAEFREHILWLGIGGLYGTVAGETFVWWDGRQRTKRKQQAVSANTTTSPQRQPVDVAVTVVDGVTGDAIASVSEVTARQWNAVNTESLSARNGQASGSLKPGKWVFSATVAGRQVEQERSVDQGQNSFRLEVPGNEVTVQVSTDDGQALGNAAVTVAGTDTKKRGSTDREGLYETRLPATTTNVEVSAEHDLYEPASESVGVGRGTEPVTLRLAPRVGNLTVKTSLGRDPVPDISVTVTRQERPRKTESGTTGSRGTVEFTGLLIGRYDLDVDLPVTGPAFSVATESATVREGSTERRNVTISFEYTLSRQHKQRIRELRGELQDIARSSRRDDAIQRYYASVLHSVLDEVERIPQSGYAFLEHNQDPDAVVDAVLDATAETVETMAEVLSSQRNVNLFSACSDLPDANVEWRGNVDISSLLTDASRGVGRQRSDANAKLEDVDEQITAELRKLAEVSPAREMWEGIRDQLRDQSGLDEMEIAASIFVALLVLDAIESVFDHRELRKRLEQTVY